MDAIANNRPTLPSLSRLDVEKPQEPFHAGTPTSLPLSSLTSPTYPPGPPPPYSQPPTTSQYTNSWSAAQAGVHTPPESRRTSHEIHDGSKQNTRHSLPSISEALGVDSKASFSSSRSSPTPSTHQSLPPTTAISSSPTSLKGPPRFDQSESGPQYQPSQSLSYPPYGRISPREQTRSQYAPILDRPSLAVQTSQPAPPMAAAPTSSHSYTHHPSSTHETQPQHSVGSMAPPSIPVGYQPYPPRYNNHAAQPPSAPPNGPIYQPSLSCPSPKTSTTTPWKSDNITRTSGPNDRQGAYPESVKRHLELFDVEAALQEIATNASIMRDFARYFGDRMHDAARTGPTASTLPNLAEIDDILNKSRAQTESILKMRDVIVAENVYEQQRVNDNHYMKTDSSAPGQSRPMDPEGHKLESLGSDTKKRRGRAAPPGRCHSCNRAETPEWRRGPDGARTLCNACGLHYAKLTRKQQGATKTAAFRSSNLRPKEE